MVETLQDATRAKGMQESPFVEINLRQFMLVALTGLIVGGLIWALTSVISTYIFHPLMCREGNGGACGGVSQYSEILATIVASAAGLFSLVRLQAFRPLLVALASAISLWGVVGYTNTIFPWYSVLITAALLYAVAYLVFMWLTRIRVFLVAVLALLVLVIAIRLLFS